jgi:hypothetical protein
MRTHTSHEVIGFGNLFSLHKARKKQRRRREGGGGLQFGIGKWKARTAECKYDKNTSTGRHPMSGARGYTAYKYKYNTNTNTNTTDTVGPTSRRALAHHI